MALTRVTAQYRCTDCADEFDHCHGTLFIHLDGTPECTSPGCADLDVARHSLTAACAELDDCDCTQPVFAGFAFAS